MVLLLRHGKNLESIGVPIALARMRLHCDVALRHNIIHLVQLKLVFLLHLFAVAFVVEDSLGVHRPSRANVGEERIVEILQLAGIPVSGRIQSFRVHEHVILVII